MERWSKSDMRILRAILESLEMNDALVNITGGRSGHGHPYPNKKGKVVYGPDPSIFEEPEEDENVQHDTHRKVKVSRAFKRK